MMLLRMFFEYGFDLNRHFETVATDVLSLYKKVTGEHLDLHVDRDEEDDE